MAHVFLSVPQLVNVGFPFASLEELPTNSSLTTRGSNSGRDNTTKEASTANKRQLRISKWTPSPTHSQSMEAKIYSSFQLIMNCSGLTKQGCVSLKDLTTP